MSEQAQAAPRRDRWAADRSPIQIAQPVYDRLTAIKEERQQLLHRQVSYTEVIEQLLEKAGAA